MSGTSTPGGGSSFNDRIRERERESAAIREEELRSSLERLRKLELDSAKRLSAGLKSMFGDMERSISGSASRIRSRASEIEAEAERMQGRIRRRILRRHLPALLAGIGLCLAVQGSVLWLAGERLIWPRLEQQALNRSGLKVATDPDGSRWIWFPEGSLIWNPEDGRRRTASANYYLMPED